MKDQNLLGQQNTQRPPYKLSNRTSILLPTSFLHKTQSHSINTTSELEVTKNSLNPLNENEENIISSKYIASPKDEITINTNNFNNETQNSECNSILPLNNSLCARLIVENTTTLAVQQPRNTQGKPRSSLSLVEQIVASKKKLDYLEKLSNQELSSSNSIQMGTSIQKQKLTRSPCVQFKTELARILSLVEQQQSQNQQSSRDVRETLNQSIFSHENNTTSIKPTNNNNDILLDSLQEDSQDDYIIASQLQNMRERSHSAQLRSRRPALQNSQGNNKSISQSLKLSTSLRRKKEQDIAKTMTGMQKNKFRDLSFFQEEDNEQISSIWLSLNRFPFLKQLQALPVVSPMSKGVALIELLFLFTSLIQVIMLPLIHSFRVTYLLEEEYFVIFITIPIIIYIISSCLKFNTAYIEENIVIKDRYLILRRLFKQRIIFYQIISIFGQIIQGTSQSYFSVVLFLLKVKLIKEYIKKIDTRFSLTQNFSHQFMILKLIFLILFLAHINGCIFNYIARDLNHSWLTQERLKQSEWFDKYINSVYFSFITMVTVGYGDITPVSISEKVFVICMTLYSCGVFGYIVSSIGNIFTEIEQRQAFFKRQLTDIVHYMKNRKIDQEIQQQVFQYLCYLEEMEKYNHLKGESILYKLSPKLQSSIRKNFYYPFLISNTILKQNFTESTLINASLQMKELTFGPGQIIFEEKDCDSKLYFVLKGSVELMHGNTHLAFKNEKDNCFGIESFVSGQPSKFIAKSSTVTQIIFLDAKDFTQILKESAQEYEVFCQLKEQFSQKIVLTNAPCILCNKANHNYLECPIYSLKHKKHLIIARSQFSNPQEERERFARSKTRIHGNALVQRQENRLCLKAIRLNYINRTLIEKETIMQLVEQTLMEESDINFFQNYEAFQIEQNEDKTGYEIIVLNEQEFKQQCRKFRNSQMMNQGIPVDVNKLTDSENEEDESDNDDDSDGCSTKKEDDKQTKGNHLSSEDFSREKENNLHRISLPMNESNPHYPQIIEEKSKQQSSLIQGSYSEVSGTPVIHQPIGMGFSGLMNQIVDKKLINLNRRTSTLTTNRNSQQGGASPKGKKQMWQNNMSSQKGGSFLNNQFQKIQTLRFGSQSQSVSDQQNAISSILQQLMQAAEQIDGQKDDNLNDEDHLNPLRFFEVDGFDKKKEFTYFFPKYNFSTIHANYMKNSRMKLLSKRKQKPQQPQNVRTMKQTNRRKDIVSLESNQSYLKSIDVKHNIQLTTSIKSINDKYNSPTIRENCKQPIDNIMNILPKTSNQSPSGLIHSEVSVSQFHPSSKFEN